VNQAIHFWYRDRSRRSRAESLLKTNQVLAEVAAIGPATGCSMPGCGIAGSGIWLAEQTGATVVGVTLVRTQVERARRTIAKRELAHAVSVEQADYTATHFPNASFDVISALESVCHTRAKAAF
jgi:tocopherol O-methyltransferase